MLLILVSRFSYYMFFRFFRLKGERQISTGELVPIYIGELGFNFIVFYNLALKQGNSVRASISSQICKSESIIVASCNNSIHQRTTMPKAVDYTGLAMRGTAYSKQNETVDGDLEESSYLKRNSYIPLVSPGSEKDNPFFKTEISQKTS